MPPAFETTQPLQEFDAPDQPREILPVDVVAAVIGTHDIPMPKPQQRGPLSSLLTLAVPAYVPVPTETIDSKDLAAMYRIKHQRLLLCTGVLFSIGAFFAGHYWGISSRSADSASPAWRIVAVGSQGVTISVPRGQKRDPSIRVINTGDRLPNGDAVLSTNGQRAILTSGIFTIIDGSPTQ